MSQSQCPRCGCEAAGQNRLVTESCGHSKCRVCLVADVSDCRECKVPREIPKPQSQKPSTTTDNHIIATKLGYHCQVCQRDFRSRTQQYYHRSCGNDLLKKFGCTECSRRFATHSHLKYHMNNHVSQSKFACSICNKLFKQQIILDRHLMTHQHQQVTYPCPRCAKEFRSPRVLRDHLAVHDEQELPHKCDICAKHFLTKSNLKQHRLKHDQSTPRHQCNVCQKSFLRLSTLRVHSQRHSKRERLQCTECSKSYNDADALARHLRQQHTAKERYRCRHCDITVNRRDNMQRHVRAIHPGELFEQYVELVKPTDEKPAESVRYNSVIKSVGNVEPVVVPIPTPTPVANPPPPPPADEVHKENVKLYRKIILDLDNEEYCNELSIDDEVPAMVQDTTRRHGSSNFSEMHWRKNFKCSYENEQTN